MNLNEQFGFKPIPFKYNIISAVLMIVILAFCIGCFAGIYALVTWILG